MILRSKRNPRWESIGRSTHCRPYPHFHRSVVRIARSPSPERVYEIHDFGRTFGRRSLSKAKYEVPRDFKEVRAVSVKRKASCAVARCQ